MTKSRLLIIFFILIYGQSYAADYDPLLEDIKEMLANNYIFPKVGQQYKERLGQCQLNQCLAELKDKEKVAATLTTMLNDVFVDKHLRVFAPDHPHSASTTDSDQSQGEQEVLSDTGVEEYTVLDGNIGFIRYSWFPGSRAAFQATRKVMQAMADTSAIIFDLRHHRGGDPGHVDIIAEFLFAKPTHFLTTRSPYQNWGKPHKLTSLPNKQAVTFAKKPVYLLVSENTASAAEHFTMALKATGRAIVVGQTTGGYGHWGGTVRLAQGFSMFVPNGGGYHPTTGLGWEGFGITPDIQVNETESLDYVLNRIKNITE